MSQTAVIIGGNIEGVQAALDIANSGIEVHLIEASDSLPAESDEPSLYLRPRLLEAANHPNITIVTGADVTGVLSDGGDLRVKLVKRARYVDTDVCTTCGRCEQACTVTLLDPATGQLRKAIHRPDSGVKAIPSSCIVDKTGVAPCTAACPAGINVQGYVALISRGRLREALELVREAVAFPHILGRVCTHPCETACTRGKVDKPIGIASLKRYIADMAPSQFTLIPTEVVAPDSPRRVAIIGAGPAGLTCARDLVRMGHNSTIFEALPVAGGMVAVGMPRFRLPREVREAEINAVTNLGVEIKTNTPIGENLTLGDLKRQGYEAIFIASGAHQNATLDIPGEDLEGVIDSIALLRATNLKQPIHVGIKVAVIGGGYTAIDSARTAIRLGRRGKRVRLLYRRTAEEMSATRAEILETTEEGVEIEYLVAPTRILGQDGKVVGIECQRMTLGEPDESGRRSPVPIEGSEFTIKVDTVITAIGQLPNLDAYEHGKIRVANNGRTFTVDPLTLATNEPGIFAGGDAVSGPRSMVEAVGDGRAAAVSLDRFLRGEDLSAGRTQARPQPVDIDIDEVRIPLGKRRRIPVRPIRERLKNFEEVETGYTTFMALREAKRCLNCGGCSECMECVRTCELDAVDHSMRDSEIELEAQAVVLATAQQDVDDTRKGIYRIDGDVAGSGLSRRMASASAVAGQVIGDLSEPGIIRTAHRRANSFSEERREASVPEVAADPRIGVFVCRCGGNISDVIDLTTLLRQLYRRGDVAYAHEIGYACSDEGALEIRETAREQGLSHVVLGACACCGLDQICFSCSDRRIECKRKLLGSGRSDGLTYEFVNIREHCAWVHPHKPEMALAKAKVLLRAGMARVWENPSEPGRPLPIRPNCLVLGDGPTSLRAAADLAAQGLQVTVVRIDRGQAGGAAIAAESPLFDSLRKRGTRIIEGSGIRAVDGYLGDFHVDIETDRELVTVQAGAIILDFGGSTPDDLPPALQKVVAQVSVGDRDLVDERIAMIPGIFVSTGLSTGEVDEAAVNAEGSAIATRVGVLLRSGTVQSLQTVVAVDPLLCRGCGTCGTVCEFGASSLKELSPGVLVATINQATCRGCGTCVGHCPSCAITQPGVTDAQITGALEAILTPF